jgi:integrase
MGRFTGADEDALVFTSPAGRPMRHSNFRQRVWRPATEAAGLPGVHLHDLRHTGNVLSAEAGASLRELMDRMGHATTRAALTYLHGNDERQRKIASNLDVLTRQELAKDDAKP